MTGVEIKNRMVVLLRRVFYMKNKVVKRVIATALVSAMAVSAAGCGNNAQPTTTDDTAATPETQIQADATATDATPETTVEPETEETPWQYQVITDADGNPIDLGGMEIVLRDWWTADEETEPANAYEEAREEYLDWIQETYNFTIKQVAISSWASTPEDFANYATTGGDENYIFILRQGSELVAAMNSGLMYDLSKLDCLDFSEEKWGNGVHEVLSKNGAIYGMSAADPEPKGGMYFNKRLLEEAGIDPMEIYELQENMEWTWDKFEELCQKVQADTDNDGVIDRYAMTNFASDLYTCAVYSNGGDFIGNDGTKYYNDLESEETMEALNWVLDMIGKYEMVYPEDAEWDYTYTAFANGEAVFSCAESYKAGQWSEMEDDFGFVCFPMGPKATDYTNIYNDNPYCIPACYDDQKAWNLAFAYNLYTQPIPGFEDYEGWKSNYYKSFRDTESVDLTLARLVTNGRVTYHNMIPGLQMGADLLWGISADKTPAQKAEEIRNTWGAYLEEANK